MGDPLRISPAEPLHGIGGHFGCWTRGSGIASQGRELTDERFLIPAEPSGHNEAKPL